MNLKFYRTGLFTVVLLGLSVAPWARAESPVASPTPDVCPVSGCTTCNQPLDIEAAALAAEAFVASYNAGLMTALAPSPTP